MIDNSNEPVQVSNDVSNKSDIGECSLPILQLKLVKELPNKLDPKILYAVANDEKRCRDLYAIDPHTGEPMIIDCFYTGKWDLRQ